MLKIAILGCENSHADAFIELIQGGRYTDVEVVGVYSDEAEACERMKKNFGVYCAASPDEFVGRVDGIMITARDGRNHYKYAAPYISSGIPMFIDKPITSDVDEAVLLVNELNRHGCRFSGGSSCPNAPEIRAFAERVAAGELGRVYGGFLRAPVSMENAYGGFWFYAQHLTEVMMKIFGYFPTSAKAYVNGCVTTVVARYPEYDVTLQFVDGNYTYYASVSAEGGVESFVYPVSSAIYAYEMDEYHELLVSGEQKKDSREFIAPVFFMDAVKRSIDSGLEEKVAEVVL